MKKTQNVVSIQRNICVDMYNNSNNNIIVINNSVVIVVCVLSFIQP